MKQQGRKENTKGKTHPSLSGKAEKVDPIVEALPCFVNRRSKIPTSQRELALKYLLPPLGTC